MTTHRHRPINQQDMVAAIKKDIRNIAAIYPTAFHLYDEPLDRLARRIATTVEAHHNAREGKE